VPKTHLVAKADMHALLAPWRAAHACRQPMRSETPMAKWATRSTPKWRSMAASKAMPAKRKADELAPDSLSHIHRVHIFSHCQD
jgi:hypothetical protein